MLVLEGKEVSQCTQKDAATPSRESLKGARAGANGVGDILRGRQRAQDAIVDNQWQAVKAREPRHFGRQTRGLQKECLTRDAVAAIVGMARGEVFPDVDPSIGREKRRRCCSRFANDTFVSIPSRRPKVGAQGAENAGSCEFCTDQSQVRSPCNFTVWCLALEVACRRN